jgi:hypothetical protein
VDAKVSWKVTGSTIPEVKPAHNHERVHEIYLGDNKKPLQPEQVNHNSLRGTSEGVKGGDYCHWEDGGHASADNA